VFQAGAVKGFRSDSGTRFSRKGLRLARVRTETTSQTLRGHTLGKHINQVKQPVSVLVTTLLALTGIAGFTQIANAVPTPPELCVASQEEADFTAMISGSDPDLIEIESTGDLVRWSQSYDSFRTSDVVIRASELVLDCVFPAIPVFEGTLNEEYASNANSISVIRFAGGVTASVVRDYDAGLGMFSKLNSAEVYNLQIEGLIESNESVTGALAGIASGTTVRNTTVTAMTIRVNNPQDMSGSEPVDCWTRDDGDTPGCIGGLVGLAWNTTLDTIRTSGDLQIESDDVFGNVGGIAGSFGFEESAVLNNLESSMNLNLNSTVEYDEYGVENVGGIIGYGVARDSGPGSHLVITNSVNRGLISISASDNTNRTGGLIGLAESQVSVLELSVISSHNYGSLTILVGGSSTDADVTGGLVGFSSSVEVLRSHNYGDLNITAEDEVDNTGGLVGEAVNVEILDSSNSGDIDVLGISDDADDIGGLVGNVASISVERSYNTGNISASVTRDDDVDEVGGLIGDAGYVTLVSVYNSGSITVSSEEDNNHIGGLVGYVGSNVSVSDSSNRGSIAVSSSGGDALYDYGGLIGHGTAATISDSYNSGTVSISNDSGSIEDVGGLIGDSRSTSVERSYNSGAISASVQRDSGVYNIGGLVGRESETDMGRGLVFRDNNNTGPITVDTPETASSIGGLVGLYGDSEFSHEFTRTENSGSISITAGRIENIGGLAGLTPNDYSGSLGITEVNRSLSYGEMIFNSISEVENIGGLIGQSLRVSIANSFSQVPTIEGSDNIGGLVGKSSGTLTVDRSYVSSAISSTGARGAVLGLAASTEAVNVSKFVWRYDNDNTSDNPDVELLVGDIGFGTLTSEDIVRTSSNLMRTQSTFSDIGWSFDSIWEMSGTDSWLCFPVLQWQEVVGDDSCGEGEENDDGDSTITSVSGSDSLVAKLGKSRILTLNGAGLGDIRSASIAGQSVRIDATKSGFAKIVIPRLPLLPSGMYKLSLINSAGAAIVVLDVRVVAKSHKLKGHSSTDAVTASLRKSIRKTSGAYSTATKVRCWGVVVNSTSAGDTTRALGRATNTCAFLDKEFPNLEVKATTRKGKPVPAKNNVVRIRFLK
jgi:hypothetical protein